MTAVLLDIRSQPGEVAWDQIVAGISLLERSVRLAAVCGASEIFVLVGQEQALVQRALDQTQSKIAPQMVCELPNADVLGVLDVWTVYERAGIKDLLSRESPTVFQFDGGQAWIGTAEDEFRPSADILTVGRWAKQVWTKADADEAERRLWLDCRKPLDGIISRHLNRYISLWISARIARWPIHPNHISVVTFSLGILAGVLAGLGGYWNFLLAGLVFQANSVIDGCDGELARVKYEFSVKGEWLDTISDDLSDVFFWAGLGVGAWHTYESSMPATWWLWLGAISVIFKFVSMALYYTWLIARGRGDLLAFTWSFDDASEESGVVARALKVLKYTTKKDFIVFAAMVLAFVGYLPWLLLAAAPGNIIVAVGVILQRRAKASQESSI